MTTRRQVLLAGALGSLVSRYAATQSRSVKIGMLVPRTIEESIYAGGVVRGLAEVGYRAGPAVILEYRSAQGVIERYPRLARELIDSGSDLIFAIGDQYPALALRDARTSVPVVFVAVDYDPLAKGIVRSLSRPEGNITGIYVPQNALVVKRLEILREVVPHARRFLVLVDPFSRDQLPAAHAAARTAGIQLSVVEFTKPPYDFVSAFDSGRKADVSGYVALASPVFSDQRATLASLLLKHELPGIGTSLQDTTAGFLLSLGSEVTKVTRRAADMGARILRGGSPADMPVEQADEFELVVNSSTARALGLKIPTSVLARATRII